jgi:hypothetical protein
LTAPTAPIGYTSDLWTYSLGDVLETVPDVLWPTSIQTFAQMRRDPRLTAILAAYKLPIERATWTLSPAGCRPEVVQLVADDLGLPVAGVDRPGAARVRGVSWAEHLRLALNTLDFGHAGFELNADTSSGQARLVGLLERPQATISTIHVDRQGALTGVSQDSRGEDKPPEISADRLCWYSREREGTNWAGVSLLRPAFAPWLLKREAQRVLATSVRRFSMGVPTVEWAAGTSPTPAQQAAALQVAQQARVGDQAGAALPPGAALVLRGLSGSTPDALGFIRWLDQQMSQMVLAGFMDLGDTANGSRALGESFVDLFLLALQSTADQVADTVTRQVAARVVAWNWGDDEPVPAVTVADVGSRQEVTAEALNSLLASGALSAEPTLEAWVRKTWRLPERKTLPEPPAQEEPSVPPEPSVTAKRRQRRKAPAQMALPIAAAAPNRELTPDELASGVDFAAIADEHDQARQDLVAQWPPIAETITAGIVTAIVFGLAVDGVAGLVDVAVPDEAVEALGSMLGEVFAAAAETVTDRVSLELDGLGLSTDLPGLDAEVIDGNARVAAKLITSGMVNGATRAALSAGTDQAAAEAAARVELDRLATAEPNWVVTSMASALASVEGTARMAAYDAMVAARGEDGVVFIASEVNDQSRCDPCGKVDGVRYGSYAEAKADRPNGQCTACLGRERCRGILFAVKA